MRDDGGPPGGTVGDVVDAELNPYAPPVAPRHAPPAPGRGSAGIRFDVALATPAQRFVGNVLAQLILWGPGVCVVLIADGADEADQAPLLSLAALLWVGVVVANVWLAVKESTTLAKRLLGMEVVTRSGAPAGLGPIAVRTAVECLIASLLSCLAIIDPLAIFQRGHQTLHDMAAGTWVVRRDAMALWREENEVVEPALAAAVEAAVAGPGRRLVGGLISYGGMLGLPLLAAFFGAMAEDMGGAPPPHGVLSMYGALGTMSLWFFANLADLATAQETIARWVAGLETVTRTGARPTTAQQLGRILVEHGTLWFGSMFLVGFLAPLGCIPALTRGRSLYDMAANVYVVDRAAFRRRSQGEP